MCKLRKLQKTDLVIAIFENKFPKNNLNEGTVNVYETAKSEGHTSQIL